MWFASTWELRQNIGNIFVMHQCDVSDYTASTICSNNKVGVGYILLAYHEYG